MPEECLGLSSALVHRCIGFQPATMTARHFWTRVAPTRLLFILFISSSTTSRCLSTTLTSHDSRSLHGMHSTARRYIWEQVTHGFIERAAFCFLIPLFSWYI